MEAAEREARSALVSVVVREATEATEALAERARAVEPEERAAQAEPEERAAPEAESAG